MYKYAIFLLLLSCNIQVVCLIFCKYHRILNMYIAKGVVFRQKYI